MDFSVIRRSLAVLMFLAVMSSAGSQAPDGSGNPMNPPSDVGIVPEHHQANGDGTVTDVGPLMNPVPQVPQGPQQQQPSSNNPYLPQQPLPPQAAAYPMNPVPGYGNEPQPQQPFQPQQQQPPPPQMMPGNGYGPVPSYGYGPMTGFNNNNNQPSGGYRQPQQQQQPGMYMGNMGYQPQPQQQQPQQQQQYNGQQMLPSNYGPVSPYAPTSGNNNGYGMGSPAGAGNMMNPQQQQQPSGSPVEPSMMGMSGRMMYAPASSGTNGQRSGSENTAVAAASAAGEYRGMDSAPYFRRR